MTARNVTTNVLMLAVVISGLALTCPASYAATLSTSGTAPTVDGLDIANLTVSTGGQAIWADRNGQGQTFMSGSEGGTLNAVTVQINEGDGTILGWKDYTLRFGTVAIGSPNTINVLVSDLAMRQDADETADTFFTFTLDTPLELAPNTLYGFDVGLAGSQEGWQQGIPQLRTSGDQLANGQRYTSQLRVNQGFGTDVNLTSGDAIFHLDIDALAIIPEPQSIALATISLLGLVGLVVQRRCRC